SEVISIVIGIEINHNIIRIPIPVTAVGVIGGRDAPIPVVESNPVRTSASQSPPVRRTKAASEPAVLERVLHAIPIIIAARVVAYPLVPAIDMRSIGMPLLIGEVALLHLLLVQAVGLVRRRRSGHAIWSRTTRWRRHRRLSMILRVLLCDYRQTQCKESCENEFRCTHHVSSFAYDERNRTRIAASVPFLLSHSSKHALPLQVARAGKYRKVTRKGMRHH